MTAFFFDSILFLVLTLATACSLSAAPILPTETPTVGVRVATWTPLVATPTDTPASVALPTPMPFSTVSSPPIVVPMIIPPSPQGSAIIDFSPAELSSHEVRLIVGYFYNGEWGNDQVFITAFANAGEKGRINEIVPDTPPVSIGNGRADIHLRLSAEGSFNSTELTICMYAAGSATPQFLCRNFPYARSWVIAAPGPGGVQVRPPIVVPPSVAPTPPSH